MKRLHFPALLITLAATIFLVYRLAKSVAPKNPSPPPAISASEIYSGISYTPVNPAQYDLTTLNTELSSPTRVKLTPDGKFLLLTQLSGELFAFRRSSTGWDPAPNLVTVIDTNFPGFPPEEAGLVSVAFSTNYQQNRTLFLLYTFKDQDGQIYNRISSLTVFENNRRLWGTSPKLIFQANVPGTSSHQITDAVGANDRLYFLIGDGFDPQKSQDFTVQLGKIMSIKEDGSDPKIHAAGLRNAYVFALHPTTSKFLIADTGPTHFDRLIYINLLGLDTSQWNLGWDGTDASLQKPIDDWTDPRINDVVLMRLPDTLTFTGLAFDGDIVYVTLFGQTGSKDNFPGKEIWKGELKHLNDRPAVTFTPIVRRRPEANNFYGNPLGLAHDPQTGQLFFTDIFEGRLYQVKPKQAK